MVRRFRRTFERLVEGLREYGQSGDVSTLKSIQQELGRRLRYIEQRVAHCKARERADRKELRQARHPKAGSAALRGVIQRWIEKRKDYQWLVFIFRCVGDALAYGHFSKWDLKPLAFRESPGRSSGKRGLRSENRVLHAFLSKGVPAVRTDLTNLIRYGDIIHLASDGTVGFVEVKSGANMDARSRRQIKAIQHMASYLDSDEAPSLYGVDHRVLRTDHFAPEVTHEQSMNDAIRESKTRGVACRSPEPGLTYIAVREDNKSLLSEALSGAREPYVFFLNEYKQKAQWTWRPFTLSIHAPEDAADFVFGDLNLIVLADRVEIRAQAESANMRLVEPSAPGFLFGLEILGEEEGSCFLSEHYFSRVGTEFVSLAWIMSELINRCRVRHEDASDSTDRP